MFLITRLCYLPLRTSKGIRFVNSNCFLSITLRNQFRALVLTWCSTLILTVVFRPQIAHFHSLYLCHSTSESLQLFSCKGLNKLAAMSHVVTKRFFTGNKMLRSLKYLLYKITNCVNHVNPVTMMRIYICCHHPFSLSISWEMVWNRQIFCQGQVGDQR